MAVPQITFPLEQSEVKPAHDKLVQHIKGLEAELRVAREMLKVLPTFCSHAGKGNYRCDTCGLTWSSGD